MTDHTSSPAAQNKPAYSIGTSGWTYDDWKGRFYPANLPKAKWFDYYAGKFNTVEINATFYRFFKDETYLKWKQRAPQGFGYALKVPQLITHRKFLVDADENIQAFYHSCSILDEKFELALLQVSPKMPIDVKRLQKALVAFPNPGKVAVEFRHPEWLNPATLSLLESVGATICNVDSPQQKLTDFLTSQHAYLRLHGRTNWYAYNYSEEELGGIATVAQNLVKKGAKHVFIYFNNDYYANATSNALKLKELLDPE